LKKNHGITAHYPAGYFHSCWFDQTPPAAERGAAALAFFQATEKEAHTALFSD